MRTIQEILALRRKGENKPDEGFTNRKTTAIPKAVASGEVIATPADIFKEVRNADN